MVNVQEYINRNFPKEARKSLKILNISGKDLEGHLDLKDFPNLEKLDCYENRITSLDLTNNKNLIYLNPSSNPISELDLSQNEKLTEIHFSYGQTNAIDLSKNKELNFVNFNNNLLENLDLTNNPNIATIHIYNNKLTSLEITNLNKLRMLACHMNPKLTGSLDLNNCPDLINLSCAFTGVEELKLNNPKLYLLYCQGSRINELDLSQTAIKETDYGKNLRTDLPKERISFQNFSEEINYQEAQEWFDEEYPKDGRDKIHLIPIDGKDLKGELKIEDFPNLETIKCFKNKLANLKIINCPKIEYLNASYNLFKNLDFLNNLNPEKLRFLSIHNNNISERDLSIFSKFINLEELYVDNSDKKKLSDGFCNHFYGSLEHLKSLKKLRLLNISETDIDSGLEHLPESLKKIECNSDTGKKCLKIKELLEEATKFDDVTEELVKNEEGDTEWSRYWYRLAPWHQFQDLLLERKPFVQKLKKQLITKEKTIFDLEKRLKKEQSQYAELREQLVLAVKEKEMDVLKERIKSLENLLVSQNNSSINVTHGHVIIGNKIDGNTTFSNYQQTQYNIQYQQLTDETEKQISESLSDKEITSQEQKIINKTILFLGTKELFINYRQNSINNLIDCYNKLEKSTGKLNRFTTASSMMNITGRLANIIPGGGVTEVSIGLVGDAINLTGNIIKGKDLEKFTKQFQEILAKDKKNLSLFDGNYLSLTNVIWSGNKTSELGEVIATIIRVLDLKKTQQNPFSDDYNAFSQSVSGIWQGRSSLELGEMKSSIEAIINDFNKLKQRLQDEKEQLSKQSWFIAVEERTDLLKEQRSQVEILPK